MHFPQDGPDLSFQVGDQALGQVHQQLGQPVSQLLLTSQKKFNEVNGALGSPSDFDFP